MKLKNIKSIGFFAVSSVLLFGSCSDEFLVEKQNYETINDDVFRYPIYAKQYVDRLYNNFLPGNNASAFVWDLATGSVSDNFTKTTDELAGETPWNRVWGSILNSQDHCLPYIGTPLTGSIVNNPYTRIRDINAFLEKIDQFGMADADKNPLKGQLYFWRAYQYFELVKLYGGVPIVLTAQVPAFEGVAGADVIKVPRSTTSACIEQIVSDLDQAKALLPGRWSGADWGRITSGATMALKGRVLLTWASPLFNRTDDVARWQRAYDANTEAKALLEQNNFGLFVTGGTANGVAWGNMWSVEVNNPEAIMVYGFNNSVLPGLKNNSHESACRPKTISGAGSIAPTKQIVDAFPMIDGRPMTSPSATYPYNPKVFYKNRDPRLSKTIAYNGSEWKYSENASFTLWTYSWKAATTTVNPGFFTEGANNRNSSGIYLRKATMDNASNTNNFRTSGTDFMEMRFAEVLLNLAESAIGVNKLAEGKDLITKVRARAGIINGDGSYGLSNVTSRDQHFAAVLNERKIEFAYENKRFHDLRRWMLFDNSTGQNTRLGIPQLEGSVRTGYFIAAKKTDGTFYTGTISADPFFVASGNAPVVNRVIASYPYTIPPTGKVPGKVIANAAEYLEYLYEHYFEIIEKTDLENSATAGWKFKWYPEYYFFGLRENIMNNAPYLEQTQGWGGTFDPLQ